jgi:hypothetical protein
MIYLENSTSYKNQITSKTFTQGPVAAQQNFTHGAVKRAQVIVRRRLPALDSIAPKKICQIGDDLHFPPFRQAQNPVFGTVIY